MDLICCKKRRNIEPPISTDVRDEKFLESVIKEKAFDVIRVTQCGNFGASLVVKHNWAENECKIQILKKTLAGEKEIECRKLNHRNLLPLLKFEYIKNADSYLLYWPVEEYTLHEKIQDKLFRRNPQALWKIISWLKEASDGLDYLHSSGYAHCDLQTKNLIINKNDVLQISQYHYLNSKNSRTNRYGLPQSLRPPQTYFDNSGTWPVKADKFESWAIGILILETFTGSYLSKKLKKPVSCWTKQVYPVIYDVLTKWKFSRLVNQAFPKAYGTVDLKSVRCLAAHALSPRTSKRPSIKEHHNLFIMLDVQKKFFSNIKMQFKKDFIWRDKVDQKKLQTYYSNLQVDDDLEWQEEENLRRVSDGRISNAETRSVEERVSLKTQDKDTLAYSAFTIHNRSAYEASIFGITSAKSEIPGIDVEATKIATSKENEFQKNIQNCKLYIGDVSPLQDKISKNLPRKKDGETDRKMRFGKHENQQLGDEILFKDMLRKVDENNDKESDCLKERTIISRENNQIDVPKKAYSITEVTSAVEAIDENEIQDPNKMSSNIFSSGRRLINRFMKFSFDFYEMTTNNYDVSNSSNYLQNLSKRLTRHKPSKE